MIAAGHPADLVLWSGDPVSCASRPLRAWVAGVEIHHED
jgi:imidazolonepropionase-like amidohydrolase